MWLFVGTLNGICGLSYLIDTLGQREEVRVTHGSLEVLLDQNDTGIGCE